MTNHHAGRRMAPRSLLRLALLAGSALAGASSVGIAGERFSSQDSDDGRFHLDHDSLVISSSTYDRSKGALASLMIGTRLPNSATATTTAVASNNYVTVWNNASVDGSFGATSPITLTDVDAFSGRVLHRRHVPEEAVVTSFSSKSELGLHIAKDWRGSHVVFVAYAGAGVGALDVSNSDAVAGQDPTNPVTFAFGTNYAFPAPSSRWMRMGDSPTHPQSTMAAIMADRLCSAPMGSTTRSVMPITAMRDVRPEQRHESRRHRDDGSGSGRPDRCAVAESDGPGQLSGGRSAAPVHVRHQD